MCGTHSPRRLADPNGATPAGPDPAQGWKMDLAVPPTRWVPPPNSGGFALLHQHRHLRKMSLTRAFGVERGIIMLVNHPFGLIKSHQGIKRKVSQEPGLAGWRC